MSKANGKATQPTAPDQGAQATSAPASSGAASLVPAPASAANGKPVKPAERTGHGGLYTRAGGVTSLTHRTQQTATSTAKDADK